MEEISTIKGRIFTFLAQNGIKKNDFYQATGLSDSNFKGKNLLSQPGGDMIVKVLTSYPTLSAEWLLMGKGEMCKNETHPAHPYSAESGLREDKGTANEADTQGNAEKTAAHPDTPVAVKTENPKEGIPLIPVEAMAGDLTDEITVLEYECERYVVPVFRGADFLIPVKGSSMYPKYSSGDIVACRRVPMSDLFFQWNKVYVIGTTQGALIKRIKPGSDQQHILIVSDNPNYDPFQLPVEAIRSVSLVIGVIRLE